MLLWLALIGLIGLACFSFVLIYGAPYLPTLTPQVEQALELIDLKRDQTLIELGSGDGKVVLAAAQQGINVVGYELNPLLFLFSRWRLRHYVRGGQVRLVWGDFWRQDWPEADGIFVFLLNPYMQKLDKKITQEITKDVNVVSFAFEIPGRKPADQLGGLYLYKYKH